MNEGINRKKLTDILVYIAVAVFLFGSGFKLGSYRTSNLKLPLVNNITNRKNLDFSLFWDAWNKVEERFIDKTKIVPQKMFYGAIRGMVASLEDPYTFFLTPDENKQSKDDLSGKFEGIGAQLGMKDGQVVVIAPLKNSPAEKAGVRAGDYIIKVNGESIKDWSLTTAVSKIRGQRGSKVTITFLRQTKEVELVIIRDIIQVESVELRYEKSITCQKNCTELGYIKINQFGDATNDEWDNKINQVRTRWQMNQIKGLILDLRDNPGGYLESSVYLASEFIPQGKLVVRQESTIKENRDYFIDRQGKLLDIPLVVLQNQGSASASEILAGVLRDYKRATIIGEKSFGKGSVQEALDLKEGAGLHVTVAKWILPNGDWINSKGIEPEIKVENKITEGSTLTRETDTQLEAAVKKLLE